MIMNIRLDYLYRDAGNYKCYGAVVFTNPQQLGVDEFTQKLQAVLIEGMYFMAHKVGVPDLRPAEFDYELDHDWHEVDQLVVTVDAANDKQGRSIQAFLLDCVNASPRWGSVR